MISGFTVLSCLCSHFHGSNPEIIHGNLTCDTVFIQHNGLIKIGCGEWVHLGLIWTDTHTCALARARARAHTHTHTHTRCIRRVGKQTI